jgi:hypothetical protein
MTGGGQRRGGLPSKEEEAEGEAKIGVGRMKEEDNAMLGRTFGLTYN